MEIKNGFVQWNGRSDIPCTYAVMEDGKNYYFKQELSNGNHIVTTSLLEFVDPSAKVQNMGLLSADGNILIPCDNSSIIMLSDDLLLVESSQPVSDNVKEVSALRQDPLSATELVKKSAQIKSNINSKMSSAGRYIKNDLSKDFTLYDGNANNVVNGEYYSYAARDNDKLYLAKNYVEADIVEFSITDKKIIEQATEPVQNVVEETPVKDEVQPIDASSELNSIYGNTNEDLGEEISIPVVDNLNIKTNNYESPTFGEIKEETPAVEVDGGENVLVTEDDYKQESEVEKSINSMKEKEARFDEYNSLLSQFQGSGVYEFNSEFKPDKIERRPVESSDDSADEDKNVIDDVSRILSGVTSTISAKDEKIRSLEEEKRELMKDNNNITVALKEAEDKGKQDAMTISALQDRVKELESENETLKTTNDLYKRRDEESKRNMKVLARAVELYESMDNGNNIITEDEEIYVR